MEFSEANLLASTLTEAVADELRFALNIKGNGNTFTFDSVRYGAGVTLWTEDGRLKAGSIDLVGEGTYTDGLRVDRFDLSYQDELFRLVMTIVNQEDKSWPK